MFHLFYEWETGLVCARPLTLFCNDNPLHQDTCDGLMQWNLSITTTYFSAKGHLDELQKADIVSKSKLVPSVFIKHIT